MFMRLSVEGRKKFENTELKTICRTSKRAWHIWNNAGRPTSGPLYDEKKSASKHIRQFIVRLCTRAHTYPGIECSIKIVLSVSTHCLSKIGYTKWHIVWPIWNFTYMNFTTIFKSFQDGYKPGQELVFSHDSIILLSSKFHSERPFWYWWNHLCH